MAFRLLRILNAFSSYNNNFLLKWPSILVCHHFKNLFVTKRRKLCYGKTVFILQLKHLA